MNLTISGILAGIMVFVAMLIVWPIVNWVFGDGFTLTYDEVKTTISASLAFGFGTANGIKNY